MDEIAISSPRSFCVSNNAVAVFTVLSSSPNISRFSSFFGIMIPSLSVWNAVLLVGYAVSVVSGTLFPAQRRAAAAALTRRGHESEGTGTSAEHAAHGAPEIAPEITPKIAPEITPNFAPKIPHSLSPGAQEALAKGIFRQTLQYSTGEPELADRRFESLAKGTAAHHGPPRALTGKIPAIGMQLARKNSDAAGKTIRAYYAAFRDKSLTLAQRELLQQWLRDRLEKQAHQVERDRQQLLDTRAGRGTDALYVLLLEQQQAVRSFNDIENSRVKIIRGSDERYTHFNRLERVEHVPDEGNRKGSTMRFHVS